MFVFYGLLIFWAVVLFAFLLSIRQQVEPSRKVAYYAFLLLLALALACGVMALFSKRYPLGNLGFRVLIGIAAPAFGYICYMVWKTNASRHG